MLAIVNARIVLERSIIEDGVLLIEDKKIVDVGGRNEVSVPEGAEIIDAGGLYVGPGFVDIHVHGGGGYHTYTNPLKAAEHFLSHGETTILSTFYIDLDKEGYLTHIKEVKEAMRSGKLGRVIRGFYMEGPYTNPKYGAMPEKNKWRGEIRAEDYEAVVEAAGEDARVWVVAPEREGIVPFLKKAKAINPAVMISMGHTEATPAQVAALKKYGLGSMTHCTNATGKPSGELGIITCGPDEACFMDKDMFAEVICDSLAIHVHEDTCNLLLAVKGIDKLVLVSDSLTSAQPNPERFAHVTDLSFDANGYVCGSKLTMDACCRNFRRFTGCSINDAFLAGARNPAQVAGLDKELGTIMPGKLANLVFVDESFNVNKVILEGDIVF